MRAGMATDAPNCSLAMLDELGVVVAWHGHAGHAEEVVNRHVSQFYPREAIAINQPLRDLHSASVAGSHTRKGWRCRPDGTIFWAVTVIDAFVLRDGRLQGFSCVTTACEGPSEDMLIAQSIHHGHDVIAGAHN